MAGTFTEAVVALLNLAMQTAYNFLTKNIYSFSPGIAGKIEAVNIALQIVAYVIFLILTFLNITSSAISIEELKRPDTILKLMLRCIFTYVAIGAAWDIICGITAGAGWIIEIAFNGSGLVVEDSWVGVVAPDFGESQLFKFIGLISSVFTQGLSLIPAMSVGLIGFCVAAVLCVEIILTVIGRYFKIYVLGAIAPLGIVCFASNETRQYARNFVNAFIGFSVEGLVIAMALIVFAGYLESPLIDTVVFEGIFSWLGDSAKELAYSYEQIFDMLLFLGIVKGSDQIVHQIFA